jgi:hypothetical protein
MTRAKAYQKRHAKARQRRRRTAQERLARDRRSVLTELPVMLSVPPAVAERGPGAQRCALKIGYLGKSIGKSLCELLSTVTGIGAHRNASRCGLLWPEDHVQKFGWHPPHVACRDTKSIGVYERRLHAELAGGLKGVVQRLILQAWTGEGALDGTVGLRGEHVQTTPRKRYTYGC